MKEGPVLHIKEYIGSGKNNVIFYYIKTFFITKSQACNPVTTISHSSTQNVTFWVKC